MSCLCFFFVVIRRPPRSTLFPTRRSSDLACRADAAGGGGEPDGAEREPGPECAGDEAEQQALECGERRSEEHTSELQSRVDLVCRLLLEKKKNKTINIEEKKVDAAPQETS